MSIDGINGGDKVPEGYTRITVKDKDSGKSFKINFVNAKITGNEASWTIKDGKLYDKNGKTVEDNILEVTRYQAALIKAAAQGDDAGDDDFLNEYDLNGSFYATAADRELKKSLSEYKVEQYEEYNGEMENGSLKVTGHVAGADAAEAGIFSAYVANDKGEKGRLIIDIRDPEEVAKQESRQMTQPPSKPWWKFW